MRSNFFASVVVMEFQYNDTDLTAHLNNNNNNNNNNNSRRNDNSNNIDDDTISLFHVVPLLWVSLPSNQ
jgi:hypothetical protein